MSKHTPGPWVKVVCSRGYQIYGPRGPLVATVHRFDAEDEEAEANADHIVALAGLNPEAVAGLVEAANKLLDARWMVTIDWAPTEDYEAVEAALCAALAKLEGETP